VALEEEKMMKPFEEFCAAIRKRESSDNYEAVNSLGFIGAYQFGMARLTDLGLAVRRDPTSSSMKNSDFKFVQGFTQERILKSKDLQDFLFHLHVQNLKKRVEARFHDSIKTIQVAGNFGTLSGCVACCHLLGMGGLAALLERGQDQQDAYGTRASEYYLKFSGYELP